MADRLPPARPQRPPVVPVASRLGGRAAGALLREKRSWSQVVSLSATGPVGVPTDRTLRVAAPPDGLGVTRQAPQPEQQPLAGAGEQAGVGLELARRLSGDDSEAGR